MRLRIVSQDGIGIVLTSTAVQDGARVDLVAGDLRVAIPLAPTASDIPAETLLPLLLSVQRLHLTELRNGAVLRTARFEPLDLQDVLHKMATECDRPALSTALQPAAPPTDAIPLAGADQPLTPDTIRLVKLAAFRLNGEERALSDLTPTLDGASGDLVAQAMVLKGLAKGSPLTSEAARALLSEFGIAILPEFTNVGAFHQGRAAIEVASGWGVIDPLGVLVIKPNFAEVHPVGQVGAMVRVAGLWAAVGPDGNRIRGARFDEVHACDEATCTYRTGSETGLFDLRLMQRTVLPFVETTGLAEGRVAVRTPEGWFLHDQMGKRLAGPVKVARLDPPQGETITVEVTPGRWQLWDAATLTPRTDTLYDEVLPDPGELAPARIGALWGHISLRDGSFVVPARFMGVGAFARGLAPASLDGNNWGYIAKSAQWVIPPIFSKAGPFRAGLARVRTAQGTGFIDTQGRMVVPFVFDDAQDFSDGMAAVRVGDSWGYIARDLLP